MMGRVPRGHGPMVPRCAGALRRATEIWPLCGLVQYRRSTCVRLRRRALPTRDRPPMMVRGCTACRDRSEPDVRAPIELPHRSGEALPIYQPAYVHGGPRDECGVVGVWWPNAPVARTAFVGLHALQHRGQESAGIAVSDGARLSLHKRLGLVSQVFDEETLARLERGDADGHGRGRLAIGHTRYSTTGSNTLPNVQPVYADADLGELMLGHNGNLTNAPWLRDELGEQGVEFVTASDTEVLAKLIAHAPGRSWSQRVAHAFHRAAGAVTFTMLTDRALVAARDPIGFRPLALGRLSDAEGRPAGWAGDSVIDGRLLYEARLAMGRQLALEHPADADLVIPVPDSAIPAAIGYAEASGLPYREGLIKSRYVGRTFIQPLQSSRDQAVRMKYTPLPEVLT